MRNIQTKNITLGLTLATIFISSLTGSSVSAQKLNSFSLVNDQQVEVLADSLNVRNGPGERFKVIGSVKKGQLLDVIGSFGEWYLVYLPDSSIGVINNLYTTDKKHLELDLASAESVQASSNITSALPALQAGQANQNTEAEKLLQLINEERLSHAMPRLELNDDISFIALTKATEMSLKGYLDHTSPTFGSPFTMLKQFGVTYKTAAENIIGNNSIEDAHKQIMQSVNHKAHVLNPRFNKIGIGIVNDEKYGKIIVEMYVE